MELSLYSVFNFIVIIILLVLLIRFVWKMWFISELYPPEWKWVKKNGGISPSLTRMLLLYPDKVRFFSWWLQVERIKREQIPGDFAEVGVYKGQSARAIHLMDPTRRFHLFDTFLGFDDHDLASETGDAATYTTRHFSDTKLKRVMKRIRGNKNVIVHMGHFPETAVEVANTTFALVNLDADLYFPTSEALKFFYQHLSPGGVIFIHDYNHRWEGIRKAVDEFSSSVPETPVLMPDPDSTAIIVKGKP